MLSSTDELEAKMIWLKNFERVQEIQQQIQWQPVTELEPRAFIPEVYRLRPKLNLLRFVVGYNKLYNKLYEKSITNRKSTANLQHVVRQTSMSNLQHLVRQTSMSNRRPPTNPQQWRHAHGARGGPGPPQIFSKDEKLFLYKNILHM